jgi:hypothetical protein
LLVILNGGENFYGGGNRDTWNKNNDKRYHINFGISLTYLKSPQLCVYPTQCLDFKCHMFYLFYFCMFNKEKEVFIKLDWEGTKYKPPILEWQIAAKSFDKKGTHAITDCSDTDRMSSDTGISLTGSWHGHSIFSTGSWHEQSLLESHLHISYAHASRGCTICDWLMAQNTHLIPPCQKTLAFPCRPTHKNWEQVASEDTQGSHCGHPTTKVAIKEVKTEDEAKE